MRAREGREGGRKEGRKEGWKEGRKEGREGGRSEATTTTRIASRKYFCLWLPSFVHG